MRPLSRGPDGKVTKHLIVRGQYAASFEGNASVALHPKPVANHPVGGSEGQGRITDIVAPAGRDVVRKGVMQQHRAGRLRPRSSGQCRQRLIVDFHQIDRVFGKSTAFSDHHGNRLTDIANAVPSQRILRTWQQRGNANKDGNQRRVLWPGVGQSKSIDHARRGTRGR